MNDMAAPTSGVYKIVLVGDCGVGKSSILLRLVDGKITSGGPPQTVGIDYKTHSFQVDGKTADLSIWDTAGQERFKSITQGYYKFASGVMIVYDPTDVESFSSVDNWIKDIGLYADPTIVRMLVENKSDLRKTQTPTGRVVVPGAGEELAATRQLLYKETSALDGTNIQAAFEDLVRAIRKSNGDQTTGVKGAVVVRTVSKTQSEGGTSGNCSC